MGTFMDKIKNFFSNERNEDRFELKGDVAVEVLIKSKTVECEIIDMSIGGICIISDDESIDDADALTINCNEFVIDLPCSVAGKKDNKFFICFDALNSETESKLDQFLTKYADTGAAGIPGIGTL